MAISAKDVTELRKQTDCGMMECKKALTEADGNFEKAIEILRERGLATAAKKASRVAAEGMVYADYCPECKVGVVIEVNAETDFVAKNDKFVAFVKEATKVIMKQNPADVEALMACKTEAGETVDEALKNLILVIKENIKVRRFTRYEGVCSAYVHGGGTHGILVNFETTNDIDAKDEFVACLLYTSCINSCSIGQPMDKEVINMENIGVTCDVCACCRPHCGSTRRHHR